MRAHRPRTALVRTAVAVAFFALAGACGGAAGSQVTARPRAEPFDGNAYIYEYASKNVPLLAVREGRVEEAEAALRAAREPTARRAAMRDLAFANVVAAEGAEEQEARKHRRKALDLVERASKNNRDDDQMRDLRFLRVWNAYRSGSRSASELVAGFTERFQDHSEVTRIAWMIKGELAFEREDWAGARDAFRFVMASLDHPFYPYALYRTAQAYTKEGRADEGRAGLADVRDRACRRSATETDVRFGRAAWAEIGEPAPADPPVEGRPEWCPTTGAVAESSGGLR